MSKGMRLLIMFFILMVVIILMMDCAKKSMHKKKAIKELPPGAPASPASWLLTPGKTYS